MSSPITPVKRVEFDCNPSAPGCCVFVTLNLNTRFSRTSSWLILFLFIRNSLNFLLFQINYVLFLKFDQTRDELMIFAARF